MEINLMCAFNCLTQNLTSFMIISFNFQIDIKFGHEDVHMEASDGGFIINTEVINIYDK